MRGGAGATNDGSFSSRSVCVAESTYRRSPSGTGILGALEADVFREARRAADVDVGETADGGERDLWCPETVSI